VKIGISTSTIEPSRTGGLLDGIGHYTMHLREGLIAGGHDVKGYAFPGLRSGSKGFLHSEAMPAPFSVMAGMTLGTMGLLPRHRVDCELFHSTDFKVVPMTVPIVATVWDAIPLLHPEWLSARSRVFAPTILRRLVPYADHVIVGTEHAGRDIVRHFRIPEDRVTVINWGIDRAWLEPIDREQKDEVLAGLGLKPGYILTVGTVQPRKNVETLLDAHALLPGATRAEHPLVLVGRFGWGNPTLLARLEAMVADGSLIWLRHGISDEQVRALYSAAAVFVLPSLYEGFGIPLLEAFASGVPVVSSNRSSLPEVSAGAAIEVDPTQPGEMAEAIASLLADDGLRREHIARGRVRASQLTQDRAIAATVELYRHVLASGKRT
jgi:glycosyltransferase involved in cell wall biosynthesis